MTDDEPQACYGMGCPHRQECGRYAELGISEGIVWAHCWDGATWAKFVQMKPEQEQQP